MRGKGRPAPGKGTPGDAHVEISVKPHPFFVRSGDDIHVELPITLSEAVLGAKVRTPTPSGAVMLTVPKGSSSGAVLRLKGKGVARANSKGDQLVTLKIMLPPEPNVELEELVSRWSAPGDFDPRKEMQ